MTPIQKFSATVLVLVVLAGGAYFFFVRSVVAPATSPTATSTPSTDATFTPTSGTNTAPTLVTPDYKKPIAFSSSISPEIRTELNASLATAQALLDKNRLDLKAWLNLGTLHKIGGDYKAAEEVWKFVTDIVPKNVAAYSNLGDLYQNFLKDYPKAETNYLKTIELEPTNINAYSSLYTLYRFMIKDTPKAAAILQKGLKANPGDAYLLSLQADLKSN
jgi:tetratricopeptide (TPR) repeat protein